MKRPPLVKLARIKYCWDFGHELYFGLLRVDRLYLLQIGLRFDEYSSPPYLYIYVGPRRLFGMTFQFFKLCFEFDLLGMAWKAEDYVYFTNEQ